MIIISSAPSAARAGGGFLLGNRAYLEKLEWSCIYILALAKPTTRSPGEGKKNNAATPGETSRDKLGRVASQRNRETRAHSHADWLK